MNRELAFSASSAATSYGTGRAKLSLARATLLSTAAMMAALTALPTKADVVYGTSNSNIVSYNTQTQVTTTIPTNFYQPYGIAYSPVNGDLYIVDRIPNVNFQKIEMYSTSGTDLGTFAAGMPYNGLSAGLTFDRSGNLYASFSNAGSGAIEEFFSGGGSTYLPGSYVFPNQMSVDGSNNLFVADIGNNNVYEYGPPRAVPVLFEHQGSGVAGVAADATGHVYISTGVNFGTIQYAAGGGAPTASPYTIAGSYGTVYDPGTNSLFGAGPPNLYQIDPTNGNPNTNYNAVSGAFPGTVYLTVQVVPEPSTLMLAALGLVGVAAWRWRRRKRSHA